MIKQEHLYNYWKERTDQLIRYLEKKELTKALSLVEETTNIEISVSDSDYIAYHILTYVHIKDFEKAKHYIQLAFQYGYFRLWYLSTRDDIKNETLFIPLHKNETLQHYIEVLRKDRPSFRDMIDKTEIATRPFCTVEKSVLSKRSARCKVSNKIIKKGDAVYRMRYFADFTHEYFAFCDAFENHPAVMENYRKFQTNSYQLSEFCHKCNYQNPYLNNLWNSLADFDLQKTLIIIANPFSFPSDYTKYHFEKTEKSYYSESEKYICARTGGPHINLLWMLIKCGYLQDILNALDQLPAHFPILLMLFDDQKIRKKVSCYMQLPELATLMPIALKNYARKTPTEVVQLVAFGKNNPAFQKQLAFVCNRYEAHLFGAVDKSINSYLSGFNEFQRAKGGGLLDFMVSNPQHIEVIDVMLKEQIVPTTATRYASPYEYSVKYLHRTIGLYYLLEGKKDFWPRLKYDKAMYKKVCSTEKQLLRI